MQYKVFGKPFPAVSLRMNRGRKYLYPVGRHELDDRWIFHGNKYPWGLDERILPYVFRRFAVYGDIHSDAG